MRSVHLLLQLPRMRHVHLPRPRSASSLWQSGCSRSGRQAPTSQLLHECRTGGPSGAVRNGSPRSSRSSTSGPMTNTSRWIRGPARWPCAHERLAWRGGSADPERLAEDIDDCEVHRDRWGRRVPWPSGAREKWGGWGEHLRALHERQGMGPHVRADEARRARVTFSSGRPGRRLTRGRSTRPRMNHPARRAQRVSLTHGRAADVRLRDPPHHHGDGVRHLPDASSDTSDCATACSVLERRRSWRRCRAACSSR